MKKRRSILSFEEVEPILSPHYDKIVKSYLDAFNDFQKILNYMVGEIKDLKNETRTKACIMHDLVRGKISENFSGVEGVEAGTWNDIFAIKINDDLLIRFNKLKDDCSPSHYPTEQAKDFINQYQIKGIPDNPTLLIAGYITDKSWTSISAIHIVCWYGKSKWNTELLTKTSYVQTVLPLVDNNIEQNIPKKRVKAKNEAEFKDGILKEGTND